mgnify:CR=1 FL=1
MRRYQARGIADWETLDAIAEHYGMRTRSVYNVAVGNRSWRTTKHAVVRALYDHGWSPAHDSRAVVKLWLDANALQSQREAEYLLTGREHPRSIPAKPRRHR